MEDLWGEDLGDVVVQKMVDRNIDPDIVEYLKDNLHRAYLDYNIEDPHDVTILNNKLEHIADRAERIDGLDLDQRSVQLSSLVAILEQKH